MCVCVGGGGEEEEERVCEVQEKVEVGKKKRLMAAETTTMPFMPLSALLSLCFRFSLHTKESARANSPASRSQIRPSSRN